MMFNVAIMSPHGYFAQSDVMGLPDTGGQVVYILDQVRALEHEMRGRLLEQGVDYEPQILVVTRLIPEAGQTTCNQRLEPISGTENARILRVPFRTPSGEVVPHWISRFEVWPYLEGFALEAQREIVAELPPNPIWSSATTRTATSSPASSASGSESPSARSPTRWRRPSTSSPISTGRTTRSTTTFRASSPPI